MAASAVTITGNLTRAAALRFTPGGSAVCNFTVACSRRWKNKSDEWEEKTSFIDCSAFGDMAENIAASTDKGTSVIVVGSLEQESWESDDGEKHNKIGIRVDECAVSLRFATASVEKNERKQR